MGVKIEIIVDIKLLRHENRPKVPAALQWKAVDKKKPQELLSMGWQSAVKLTGWWQDQLLHFQGKAEPVMKSDKRWLAWAFIPWKKVDMRFDANGANVLVEWKPGGDGTWFKSTRNGN